MSTHALDTLDEPHPAPSGRRTPRWASLMIALGIMMTTLVGPVVFPDSSGQAEASAGRHYAACYYPVAGWLVMERRCDSVHRLPLAVQRCIFGLAGAAAIAAAIGGPLAPAVGGALVGCGGSLMR